MNTENQQNHFTVELIKKIEGLVNFNRRNACTMDENSKRQRVIALDQTVITSGGKFVKCFCFTKLSSHLVREIILYLNLDEILPILRHLNHSGHQVSKLLRRQHGLRDSGRMCGQLKVNSLHRGQIGLCSINHDLDAYRKWFNARLKFICWRECVGDVHVRAVLQWLEKATPHELKQVGMKVMRLATEMKQV